MIVNALKDLNIVLLRDRAAGRCTEIRFETSGLNGKRLTGAEVIRKPKTDPNGVCQEIKQSKLYKYNIRNFRTESEKLERLK